jgi:hypothetical protein
MTGVEVLEALIAAMRRGDLDAAAALIHPDVMVSEPASLPYGGVPATAQCRPSSMTKLETYQRNVARTIPVIVLEPRSA